MAANAPNLDPEWADLMIARWEPKEGVSQNEASSGIKRLL